MDQESPRYSIISLTHIRVCARAAMPLALGVSLLVGAPAFGDEPLPPEIRGQMTKLGKDIADYEHQRDTLKKEIETKTDAKTGRPLTPQEIRDKRTELETVEHKLKSVEANRDLVAEEARQVAEAAHKERKLQYALPELIRQLRANPDPVSRQAAEAYEAQLRSLNQKYGPIASVPPVAAPGAVVALDDNDCRKHVPMLHLVQSPAGQGTAPAPAPGGQTRDEPLPEEIVMQIKQLAREAAYYDIRKQRLEREVTSRKDSDTGRPLTEKEIAERQKKLDTVNQKFQEIQLITRFMNESARDLFYETELVEHNRQVLEIKRPGRERESELPSPPPSQPPSPPSATGATEPIEDILKEVEERSGPQGDEPLPEQAVKYIRELGRDMAHLTFQYDVLDREVKLGIDDETGQSLTPEEIAEKRKELDTVTHKIDEIEGLINSGFWSKRAQPEYEKAFMDERREVILPIIRQKERRRSFGDLFEQGPPGTAPPGTTGAMPGGSMPSGPQPVNLVVTGQVTYLTKGGTKETSTATIKEQTTARVTVTHHSPKENPSQWCLRATHPWTPSAAWPPAFGYVRPDNTYSVEVQIPEEDILHEAELDQLWMVANVALLNEVWPFFGYTPVGLPRQVGLALFALGVIQATADIAIDDRPSFIGQLNPDANVWQISQDLEQAGFPGRDAWTSWRNPFGSDIMEYRFKHPSDVNRFTDIVGSRAAYVEPNDDRVAAPAPSLNPLRWPRTQAAAIPRRALHVPSFEE